MKASPADGGSPLGAGRGALCAPFRAEEADFLVWWPSIILALVYFVLSSLFRSLGGNGVVAPLVAGWTTNLLFVIGRISPALSGRSGLSYVCHERR